MSYQSRLRYGVWPDRLAPIAAIGHYHGPLLIIGGEVDRYTPITETRELLSAANGNKRLFIARGLDHAAVSSAASPEYRAALRGFLQSTIGRPTHS